MSIYIPTALMTLMACGNLWQKKPADAYIVGIILLSVISVNNV